ncbi:Alpha carbonic anhydrase 4 [Sesamum alatum]|uniref:Alpha carbonic anhydrase 4 n=1 Tax=Sesamum alatum TaxID=300844 RepID=A0AAE1XJD9_9LAMI|nr:Alpha carbonic anhydrase 4 [Sesamum alatum]
MGVKNNSSTIVLFGCLFLTLLFITVNADDTETDFNMELHIVHVNSRGDIAVVGILYELGPADPFLAQFLPFLASATEEGFPLGNVDPSSIKIPYREYYRYNGSLTTPPCSENVTWTIFKRVKTVSIEQVRALRDSIDDGDTGNARPIQPLNGRTIYVFEPKTYT